MQWTMVVVGIIQSMAVKRESTMVNVLRGIIRDLDTFETSGKLEMVMSWLIIIPRPCTDGSIDQGRYEGKIGEVTVLNF